MLCQHDRRTTAGRAGHDHTQHANQQLSPGHVPDLTTSAFHVGQGIKVANLAMEIRSHERKRLARERQH